MAKRNLTELTTDTFLKLEEGQEIEVRVAWCERATSTNYEREVNRFTLEVVESETYTKGDVVIWESTSSGSYNLYRAFHDSLDNVELTKEGVVESDFRKSYVIKRDTDRLYTVFSIA